MMKRILLSSAIILGVGSFYAQETKQLNTNEVNHTLKQNEGTKFFTIMPLPSEKENAKEIKGEVSISDRNNINLKELNIQVLPSEWQYYRIKGTKELLVIYSREFINSQKNK